MVTSEQIQAAWYTDKFQNQLRMLIAMANRYKGQDFSCVILDTIEADLKNYSRTMLRIIRDGVYDWQKS